MRIHSTQDKSVLNRILVKKYAMLTTLKLISSIFTVLLAITEPDAGDAVPTGTGEMALLTPGPMGHWHIPTQRRKFRLGYEIEPGTLVCFAIWDVQWLFWSLSLPR